jgi:hypothetical protein
VKKAPLKKKICKPICSNPYGIRFNTNYFIISELPKLNLWPVIKERYGLNIYLCTDNRVYENSIVV